MASNIWWLSFGEPGKHLGVSIIEAPTMIEAMHKAHRLSCNPGGQVAATVLDRREWGNRPINCALSREQIEEFGERYGE